MHFGFILSNFSSIAMKPKTKQKQKTSQGNKNLINKCKLIKIHICNPFWVYTKLSF